MQLKNQSTGSPLKNVSLAEKLTLATTALLGASANAQQVDAEWNYSASLLAYSEPDRVSATELIVTADKAYGDAAKLDLKVVLDSLTGASANGAIEQDNPQTFTRPSGKGQFVTAANNTPLDDTFKDTRLQIAASWTDSITEQSRYTIATNLSREYDYRSVGASGELAWDFNQKNTTLSAGLSFASDEILPEGDIPLAFSSMVIDQGQFVTEDEYWNAFDATRIAESDTVSTSELLLGWTQVINRQMLVQLNYGYADMQGYLTDPFKLLSVVDDNGQTQDLVYENRPDSRTQHSLFALTKYHFDESIFDLSYRYISDDWEMKSHTIDSHWRFMTEGGSFWEPHVRIYLQDAAEFYQPFLAQSQTTPEFASADYRIGDMSAMTVGLKYGFQLEGGERAEVRLEYYRQTPNKANQSSVSGLENIELYPEVDALILQFNYYF